eukprot:scaffold140037_cov32-Prasinocladus_malaysianus.AAC.1
MQSNSHIESGSVIPTALSAARQRCELIADVLGLSGVARVDAFMHADTGELVVIEVRSLAAVSALHPLPVQTRIN